MSAVAYLVDRIEAEIFPRTRQIQRLRLTHWAYCDFARHYRERAAACGVQRTARQMRKQGFGLQTALSVLAPKRARVGI